MSSLCKTTVVKMYQEVIDDVIGNVREFFLEEGVDEQVLQDLKQTWEAKLLASKAVDQPNVLQVEPAVQSSFSGPSQPQPQAAANNKMVPIQITLPGQGGAAPTVLTIQVPAYALVNNQLCKILSGPVITATMSLAPETACKVLQQHVNAALSSQALSSTSGGATAKPVPKTETAEPASFLQIDGNTETSDEDEDGISLSNESDDHELEKEEEEREGGESDKGEEPLNSGDDVSEEDPDELFDSENVVVCQYDKISRSRNKWKFHLKDGIMNLDGNDYVFQKATGDAEW